MSLKSCQNILCGLFLHGIVLLPLKTMAVIERKIKLYGKKKKKAKKQTQAVVEGGKVTAKFPYLHFCVTLKEKQKIKKMKYVITFMACELDQLTNLLMPSLNFHSY